MNKIMTCFLNRKVKFVSIFLISILTLGLVGCKGKDTDTAEEKAIREKNNKICQAILQESEAKLEEDYNNEQALADYAGAMVLSHKNEKQQAIENKEEDKFQEAIREDYKKLATYAYAYQNKIPSKDVDWDKIYEGEMKYFAQTGKVTTKSGNSNEGILHTKVKFPSYTFEDDEYEEEEDDELSFPYNTRPRAIILVAVYISKDGLTFIYDVNITQMVMNEVYFKWVDKRLARGDDPNDLVWDIYVKGEWIYEEVPRPFENMPVRDKNNSEYSDKTETVPNENEEKAEEKDDNKENIPENFKTELYVITEQEFATGTMMNMSPMVEMVEIAEDEYIQSVISNIHSVVQSWGFSEGSGSTKVGRSCPIPFGIDAKAAGEQIGVDIIGFLSANGSHYEIIAVTKAANGYIFHYNLEK